MVALVLAGLCAGGLIQSAQAREDTSKELTYRYGNQTVPAGPARSVDFESDGNSELLASDDQALYIHDADDWTLRSSSERVSLDADTLRASSIHLLDRDGDGIAELFVPLLHAGKSFITAVSRHDQRVWTSDSLATYHFWPRSERLSAFVLMDLLVYGDRRFLIATVETGYLLRPRGIGCFDLRSGQLEWLVELASSPRSIAIADLCGNDGVPEILVGTFAPGNGVRVQGEDDSKASLLLLDANGMVIWKRVVGGAKVSVQVAAQDLDQDGQAEAISLRSAGVDSDSYSEIGVWDATAGKLLHQRVVSRGMVSHWQVANFDQDGALEVLLPLPSGELLLLDGDLSEAKRLPVFASALIEVNPVDLSGDGDAELFCRAGDSLAILDYSMTRTLARGPYPGGPLIIKGEGQGREVAYARSASSYLGRIELTDIVTPSCITPLEAVLVAASGFLVGVVVARLPRRKIPPADSLGPWVQLHLALREFQHGELSGRRLTELERGLRLAQAGRGLTGGADSEPDQQLSALAGGFLREAGPQIEQVIAWTHRVQARGARSGSFGLQCWVELQPALRELAASGVQPTQFDKLLRTLARFVEELRSLQAEIRERLACDCLDVVRKVLDDEVSAISKHAVSEAAAGFQPEVTLTVRSFPRAFITAEDLNLVLSQLVANAGRAMTNVPKPRLAVDVDADPLHTRIRIKDNGCGIPEADWERIFANGVTTKRLESGHGQGLALCRERIAPYRGTLRVVESCVGLGSTFELRLETTQMVKAAVATAAAPRGR